jgi:hypothetical protein
MPHTTTHKQTTGKKSLVSRDQLMYNELELLKRLELAQYQRYMISTVYFHQVDVFNQFILKVS